MKSLLITLGLLVSGLVSAQSENDVDSVSFPVFGGDSLLRVYSEEDYRNVTIYEGDVLRSLKTAKVVGCKIDTFGYVVDGSQRDSLVKTIEFEVKEGGLILNVYIASKAVLYIPPKVIPVSQGLKEKYPYLHLKPLLTRNIKPIVYETDYVQISTIFGNIPENENEQLNPKYLRMFNHILNKIEIQPLEKTINYYSYE